MAAELHSPAARARARGRACALVAELWARGLDGETAAAWSRLAGFAEVLPTELDPDEAAAEHHRVASSELFPYESVFLHPQGLLGGEPVGAVRALREAVGLGEPRELEVDHLAEELRLLAFLAGIERVAMRGEADLERVRADQRTLLDDHLLRWLPGFVAVLPAVDPGPDGRGGLYARATEVVLELCLAWRQELGGGPGSWELPPAPRDLLDQERTGLKRISQHLCVPAMAGGFLSAACLRQLGRQLELPRGFGKRWQQLESLLQAAAHYSALPWVLQGLDQELERWDRTWAGLPPELQPVAAPWRTRIGESRAMLQRLSVAARDTVSP